MKDPELADAPDTPQDIAWEARHCADRLDSLAELSWDTSVPPEATDALHEAAIRARRGARWLEGREL